ncbi:putative ABC transport system permease protein [Paenibacillus uliginis N3/975]|uniref:Putative ABC transport system permease protein n=1 Tax=Paenibacillus uliginis N3/975 TaxID=1313296 RepID=A0A1X7HL65_9BACL|nr:ABC transporter permease [Paenibacillus uliginis]SMF88742.1 putative ABC transport system permease protein [Paenibacillus uliginis N3/975]
MTLFSIAKKNIVQNFNNYFLYFASMIFSIVIYFTFVSLKYDTTIQATSDGSPKISSVFSGAAFVLMIFVAIFIWYSNSFFTRKRKKEVGLYSLLGVRKKQIGRMLFYENFIMGILALVIGILIGSVLSKFFVSILMKVMGYEAITNFSISSEAVINTVLVFVVITLITSFQGYRLIYRFKLIDLFQADKEGEQEPNASIIVALLSLILIGLGYWIALQNFLESNVWKSLGFAITPMVILVTVILGTYLLFSTLTVYLLKMSRKNKKNYWKGINIIGTSQLLYRIKGNARTLTIIAVLSATTLTAVGTAYSLYYNNRSSVETINPNSMMFIATDKNLTKLVEDIVSNNKDHNVVFHQSIPTLQLDADITNLKDKFSNDEEKYTIISNSHFNELAKAQDRNDFLSLKANEAAALDAVYMEGMSPKYVGATISLKLNGSDEKITFTNLKKYSVLNLYTAYTSLVVSDELFAKLEKEANPTYMEVYNITNEDDAEQLTKDIQSIVPDEAAFSSFYANYASGLESSGLLIFMGGFLGLVFLAATGSIIYFKQLTEANSDKGRYEILNKIGVNKKEVRKSIAKQVLFVFALPLLAGSAHSIVALTALSKLLQTNLVIPVVICMGVYTCIYIVYYFLTVNAYYKIVTKSN